MENIRREFLGFRSGISEEVAFDLRPKGRLSVRVEMRDWTGAGRGRQRLEDVEGL